MARRRKSTKKPKAASVAMKSANKMLRVASMTLDRLEIAKAHDGLFRGSPEPVIVVGVYGDEPRVPRILARSVVHFASPRAVPCTVVPAEKEEPRVEARLRASPDARFFALVCALEIDDGTGVARAFEALDDAERLLAYRADEREPRVHSLASLPPPRAGEPIELMAKERPFGEIVSGDDWIGASFVPIASRDVAVRCRFQNDENDWTLVARFDLR